MYIFILTFTQVVVGMTVPQVREAFEQMVEDQSSEDK